MKSAAIGSAHHSPAAAFATSPMSWARRSAPSDPIRAPVKSQRTTKPASASISESAPKPIRAIELAAMPAARAIANSTK
jgi:hypothetical protein